MNEILEQALLYDFYGELLTAHQKRIYEQVVIEDLSLSEIAAEEGISRQGVHDLVKRCNKALVAYELKLHLVEKFINIKNKVEELNEVIDLDTLDQKNTTNILASVKRISEEILEEL